jgi:hypothetical protein
MNNEQILLGKKNSIKKQNKVLGELTAEFQQLQQTKVLQKFNLCLLSRERKDLIMQVEIAKRLRDELQHKVDSLSNVFYKLKVQLKFHQREFEDLDELVAMLATKINLCILENNAVEYEVKDALSALTEKGVLKKTLIEELNEVECQLSQKVINLESVTKQVTVLMNEIDELNLKKKAVNDENLEIENLINQAQKKLKLQVDELESKTILLDQEVLISKNKNEYLEKIDLQINEAEAKVNINKAQILGIQKEMSRISSLIILKSAEFEKLKELEMLTSLTLEHVQKEEIDLTARLKSINERKIKKEQSLIKSSLKLDI